MSTVVIDLYESGILISDGKRILANSPACALVDTPTDILVGNAAEKQMHLRPQDINTGFWADLGGQSTTRHAVSHAELALHHLQFAWSLLDRQDHDALLAVSGTLRKRELGLALGICEKLDISVLGIVNKAVLAIPGPVPEARLVWLAVLQERTILSLVAQDRKQVSASRPGRVIPYGLQSLMQVQAKWIAAAFVRETRFDPLQKGEDEQLLYERLPHWLATLQSLESVGCELHTEGQSHRIQLHRNEVLGINQAVFEEIAICLSELLPDHKVAIVCSPTCNQVFGLNEFLKNLPGCVTLGTDPTRIARQALRYREQICTGDKAVHYTTTLRWDKSTRVELLEPNSGLLASLPNCPTHLLIGSDAWPLGEKQELQLTRDHHEIRLALDPVCNESGVCRIQKKSMRIELRHLKNYKIRLNDRRLSEPQTVQSGDRLRIDGYRNEVLFIKVQEHETPHS